MSDPSTALTQLFAVGIVWLSVHCVCMCGPLLSGLDVTGARHGRNVIQGALRLLVYQAGRAGTYALLGAAAGALGKTLGDIFAPLGAVFSILMGAALIGSVGYKAWRTRHPRAPKAAPVQVAHNADALVVLGRPKREPRPALGEKLRGFARRIAAMQNDSGLLATYLLGAVLAFMPCMVTLWALGLAALSASPAYGALVMVSLVALTTPILLLATGVLGRAGAFLSKIPGRWRARAEAAAMVFSGALLVLVGLASVDVIDHAHVTFFGSSGRHYMLMFW